MATFEQHYEEAVASGLIPGAVLLAIDRQGDFTYRKCFGTTSLNPNRSNPLDENKILAIASCSKLMTSVAAMQLVDRGKLDLDADVAAIIPEVKRYGIITALDDDSKEPTFVPNQNPVTLRLLLSGSSGYVYEALNPLLEKWRASRNEEIFGGETVEQKCTIPLSFEPGTAWGYGGYDWAGKIVERVTNQSLEDYMKKNIWDVLGLKDITFWPDSREEFADRRVDVAMVDETKLKAQIIDFKYDLTNGAKDCIGGGGIYASAANYLEFLAAVLREDERIISKASFAELFKPQLSEAAAASLNEMIKLSPLAARYFGINVPPESPRDYSMAGIVCMEDQPGWHRKGTVMWGGATNITWFIDRKTGLCGLAACQAHPPMIQSIMSLHSQFQRGIYELYRT